MLDTNTSTGFLEDFKIEFTTYVRYEKFVCGLT